MLRPGERLDMKLMMILVLMVIMEQEILVRVMAVLVGVIMELMIALKQLIWEHLMKPMTHLI